MKEIQDADVRGLLQELQSWSDRKVSLPDREKKRPAKAKWIGMGKETSWKGSGGCPFYFHPGKGDGVKAANQALVLFAAIQLFFMLLVCPISALSPTQPVKGMILPPISLPIPRATEEKVYLGLSGDGHFRISQIGAKAVIITLLSLHCSTCGMTAAEVKDLFYRIESYPDLKGKMKLIGIGAGNTRHEVEIFKRTYQIPFPVPVFPDEDFRIHKALGDVRIPFYIAVKIGALNKHEIVHTHLGGITEGESFFNLMLQVFEFKAGDSLRTKEEFANSLPHGSY